jgi:hypothetical protein
MRRADDDCIVGEQRRAAARRQNDALWLDPDDLGLKAELQPPLRGQVLDRRSVPTRARLIASPR